MKENNRLILIGNGFDLAHGLKTSYKDFLDWYMCEAFQQFCKNQNYNDTLIEMRNKYSRMHGDIRIQPKNFEEVINFFSDNDYRSMMYNSDFFRRLIQRFKENNWVDIEIYYFRRLKSYFSNPNFPDKKEAVCKLNSEFNFLITRLSNYVRSINNSLSETAKLPIESSRCSLKKAFAESASSSVRFLNFNYTETLLAKHYAEEVEIIHIHGRVADIARNPIIFGYGDESDPVYQKIEDSGQNLYLEHIKSFGYFMTDNYHKLLSYIDSDPYEVYVVGHSCGLSDRVLLNEIFEHKNCVKVEICYHVSGDGSDNFKEITQEISRHFKPQNKNMMRRKICNKNDRNIIPQNKIPSAIG